MMRSAEITTTWQGLIKKKANCKFHQGEFPKAEKVRERLRERRLKNNTMVHGV